ncbi:MAG: HDOD domain-containing protein [Gammaproteobacteria bacterium]|nr:HDOD domain-containing protein [Gammaproteobacteria bacterium]
MSVDYAQLVNKIHKAVDDGRIRLPSFPENLIKVRDALNDPETSIRTLAQLVHSDSVLAGRIYAVAGSSAYALDTEKLSLVSIMSYLGLNMIRSTIYNHCLSQLFNDRRFKRVEDVVSFVRNRSLELAGIAYAISKRYRAEEPSLALLSGLFHNVGALVIVSWIAQTGGQGLDVKEQKTLVIKGQHSFADRILENWSVPEHLKRVIQAGESEVDAGDERDKYVHLIAVARWVSRILRNPKTIEDPPMTSLKLFNIDVDQVLLDKDEILADMIKIIQSIR